MSPEKRVEIILTEQLVATDQESEVQAKARRLVEAMKRHGVPEGDIRITEGFVGAHGRSLIATGMGKPIEMSEEMEKRRRLESEAAAQTAIVTIARSIEANQRAVTGEAEDEMARLKQQLAATEAEKLATTNQVNAEKAAAAEKAKADAAKIAELETALAAKTAPASDTPPATEIAKKK